MAAMARRKLSMRGRVLAGALSVGVAGGLAGLMAANDHTASASASTSSNPSASSSSGDDRARPYDPSGSFDDGNSYSPRDDGGFSGGDSSSSDSASSDNSFSAPQSHTRSGGS